MIDNLTKLKVRSNYPNAYQDTLTNLLAKSEFTASDLRAMKIADFSMKDLIRIEQVQTDQTYLEVLKLRHAAYLDAEKIPAQTKASEMTSAWDRFGCVYGIFIGQRIIATLRIVVPSSGDSIESVDFALGEYPSSFPDKSKIIEVSHLCIQRGFRQTDLLKLIFNHVHRVLVETDRSHIVISADSRLQKKYRFIGFSLTGHEYLKPNSKYAKLKIMITNQRPLGIYGLHADPIRWNLFLADITKELLADGVLRHGYFAKVIFSIYRWFAPLSSWLEKRLAR